MNQLYYLVNIRVSLLVCANVNTSSLRAGEPAWPMDRNALGQEAGARPAVLDPGTSKGRWQ